MELWGSSPTKIPFLKYSRCVVELQRVERKRRDAFGPGPASGLIGYLAGPALDRDTIDRTRRGIYIGIGGFI